MVTAAFPNDRTIGILDNIFILDRLSLAGGEGHRPAPGVVIHPIQWDSLRRIPIAQLRHVANDINVLPIIGYVSNFGKGDQHEEEGVGVTVGGKGVFVGRDVFVGVGVGAAPPAIKIEPQRADTGTDTFPLETV